MTKSVWRKASLGSSATAATCPSGPGVGSWMSSPTTTSARWQVPHGRGMTVCWRRSPPLTRSVCSGASCVCTRPGCGVTGRSGPLASSSARHTRSLSSRSTVRSSTCGPRRAACSLGSWVRPTPESRRSRRSGWPTWPGNAPRKAARTGGWRTAGSGSTSTTPEARSSGFTMRRTPPRRMWCGRSSVDCWHLTPSRRSPTTSTPGGAGSERGGPA